MKKITALLVVAAIGTGTFAETFSGGEDMVDNFLKYGSFVKYYWDKDNTRYMPKSVIDYIRIDEDDLSIYTSRYNAMTGKNDTSVKFDIDDFYISLDDDANLIIRKRK